MPNFPPISFFLHPKAFLSLYRTHHPAAASVLFSFIISAWRRHYLFRVLNTFATFIPRTQSLHPVIGSWEKMGDYVHLLGMGTKISGVEDLKIDPSALASFPFLSISCDGRCVVAGVLSIAGVNPVEDQFRELRITALVLRNGTIAYCDVNR